MVMLMKKMLRSSVLLFLASIVIIYLVYISTIYEFFVNKFNLSIMSQAIFDYYKNLIGNQSFGMSIQWTAVPVNEIVADRYGKSLKIIIPAFIISIVFGILLGILHFLVREKKVQNRLHKINHLFFGTVPDFFLLIAIQYGLILLIRADLIELDLFGDETWFNLFFPTLIICITPIFYISNITFHSLMIEKDRDYVRTAMSKGTGQTIITLKHLLWNAWPTILGYTQTLMLFIISSLPIIERLTFYGGAGQQLIMSLKANDATVVLGLLMPFLLLVLITSWITDIIKLFITPSSLEQELSDVTIRANRLKRVRHFIKSFPNKLFNSLKVFPQKLLMGIYTLIKLPFKVIKGIYKLIKLILYIFIKRSINLVKTFSFIKIIKTIFTFIKEYPAFNLGVLLLGGIVMMAIIGPSMPFVDNELKGFRIGYDENGKLLKAPMPPGEDYWFGTNREGRDLFSIIIHGARETLLQLLVIAAIRFFISIPLGYFASVHKGARNLLGFSNSMLSFLPTIILVMLIGSIPPIQESAGRYMVLVIFIALLDIGRIGEIMRQEFTKINRTEFMLAAVATGTNWYNIIIRHYIPNIYQKIMYIFISDMARIMVLLGGLGIVDVFLAQELSWDPNFGLTVENLTYTWASLLSDAIRDLQTAPWITFFPSLFIAILIMGLNLFGVGLKEVLDKQKKKKEQQESENHLKQWTTNEATRKISV
ncbi:ABC transporter permease subunit [Bacillus sp. AK128]